MKTILGILVMALLVLAVAPGVLAEGDDTDVGVDVDVDDINDAPRVCTDSTQRSLYPNDQTIYTAEEYGDSYINNYGDTYYEVSIRGNYVFQGETVTYYTLVEDEDGENDIETVVLQKNSIGVGSCSEIDDDSYDGNTYNQFDCGTIVYDDDTMNLYRCRLIVQGGWTGTNEINVKATDEPGLSGTSTWKDQLIMNPTLSVTLTGSVNFGTVAPGTTVTSDTIYLNNVGSNGVVMDMYIASEDYFTDPTNPAAICGVGNGIPYDAFSYYATKGFLDSGNNSNSYEGLGSDDCAAESDEYTEMPSHSGDIDDMCRIINHRREGSFLTQGQSMSLTFQLDVPSPCQGSFTDGKFYFVGKAV